MTPSILVTKTKGYAVIGHKRQKKITVWPSYFDASYEATSKRVGNLRGKQGYKIYEVTLHLKENDNGDNE